MINNKVIIEEGFKLFRTNGFHISMDELAKRVHISKKTLYEQIKTKSDLIISIVDYFDKQLDEEKNKNLEDKNKNNFDVFVEELVLYAKIAFISQNDLIKMKALYPEAYDHYIKVTDERWDKMYSTIETYLKPVNKMNFDKDLFKTLFLSSLDGISLNKNELDYNDLIRKFIDLLMNGVNPNFSNLNNFIKLLTLLYNSTIGVSIISIEPIIETIYLSNNFNNLYNLNNCTDIDEIFNKIKITSTNNIRNLIQNKVKEMGNIEFHYQFESNGMQKKHYLKAAPIDIKGRNKSYIILVTDETEINEKNQIIKIQDEHLKLVFEQINVGVWEYDFTLDQLKLSKKAQEEIGYEVQVLNSFSKIAINNKLVDKTTYDASINFINNILSGKETDTVNILLSDAYGKNNWIKASYKLVYNDDNSPKIAVGVIEKLNYMNDVKSRFEQEKLLPKLVEKELLLTIEFNITKNQIIELRHKGCYDYIKDVNNYDELVSKILNRFANEEDKMRFNDLYEYKKLKEIGQSGKNSTHINYRFIKDDGTIEWLSYTVNYVIEPVTGDQYIFGYVRNIDNKMRMELLCNRKVEYDVTTRLYIPSTMQKMTNLMISKQDNMNTICGMALIEISNFAIIKRQYGLDIGEKVLFFVGRILRICFNNKNTVGRVADNQFAIFFPNIVSMNETKKIVEEAISLAQDSYKLSTEKKEIAKINASIYFSRIKSIFYDHLYKESVKLLNQIENKENCEIVTNIEKFNSAFVTYSDDLITFKDNDNSIIEQMKKSSLEATYKDSINKILFYINNYYQAYRSSVFILKNSTLYLSYEYTSSDIYDFDSFKIGIKELPGLYLIYKKQSNIIIPNIEIIKNVSKHDYEYLKANNINSIYFVPLFNKGQIIGYVSAMNLTNHLDNPYYLESMSLKITSDLVKSQLEEDKQFTMEHDVLTEVYNHATFVKKVNLFKNSHLNSLGVASIKLNGLKYINMELGSEYGDSILKAMSKTLKKNFRKEDIFKTDSSRFDIICADIDYQLFVDKVQKSIQEIKTLINEDVIVGYTWNDNDIDVDLMLEHSEEIMFANYTNQEDKEFFSDELDVDSLLKNHNFEIYLQPKFYLENLQIESCEALIRLNHPKLGLINPGKFIPLFEKKGVISKVDLFVLEEVCKLIRKWLDNNEQVIPIAINYSRKTILVDNIVDYTLDVLNKYKIDPSLIEIEITESIGNMEQSKLSEISQKFINHGIKLSIDDFGSKYSSLSTLSVIPFSSVKLDKSIVNDLVINKRSQVIVEYIIMMCKNLNMKSIAEGIENEEQLNELKKRGCMIGQGYYFEKPMPINEFEEKYKKAE